MPFQSGFEHILREHEAMAPYTWLRLGGEVEYFAEPTSVEELVQLVQRCHQENMPVRLLGGGSNVLIRSEGVKGLVIHLSAGRFCDVRADDSGLTAGGGAKLSHLISAAVREGLAGLEPALRVGDTPRFATNWTDPGPLANGQAYYYHVATWDEFMHLSWVMSPEASGTPYAPPSAPQGLRLVPGEDRVTVSWSPAVAGTWPVSGYEVYRATWPDLACPGPLVARVTGGFLQYIDNGVVNGTRYHYRVSAWDDRGNRSACSATQYAIPMVEPDPPGETAPSPEYAADNLSRNLDRQYPGKAGGNLTQRIAFALTALIRREGVDLAFDLHEAPPGSRLAMMIIANPKNVDLAAEAVMSLEAEGLAMKLEESSRDFRGLSHREWGDATPAKAFLFETPNPAFLREKPGHPVDDPEWPLVRRVGIHIEALRAIVEAYNGGAPAVIFCFVWLYISAAGPGPGSRGPSQRPLAAPLQRCGLA